MEHGPRAFENHGVEVAQAGAAKALAAEDMREYAIFALDADGNVSSWNAGAERVKGYRSDEIIGKHFSCFYPAGAVAVGYPDWELEQAAANGFFIDRGWRVRRDGERFWAHVVITAQRTPAGELDGFIKVTRDESEANVRQQRSRRQFADLFELASSGIALLDDGGNFLDANGALGDLLGYRLSELWAKTDRDLLHPRDGGDGLLPSTSGPASGGVDEPIPHRMLVRSDGELVLCQVSSRASVRDDGSRSWLAVFHDVTEQVRQAEVLRHEATHDDMTGLLNRRGFEELLSSLLGADSADLAVLFCDLDNFKRVNDSLGHEAGDELLVAVAERLTTELPPKCTPARFYGDEFVIVCSHPGSPDELETLTRAVDDLFRIAVPLRGRMVHLSASVGATTAVDSGASVGDLLQSSEAAMLGKRRIEQGQRVDSIRSDGDQLALEEDLRAAIERDRLDLHYQPIVANDGSVIIAEALLRWTHPELGLLTPDVVLDVAAQGGLLADLDRCVLRRALRESADWQVPGENPLCIAVNLGGLRPDQPGFVAEVRSMIDDEGVDPNRVVLEMLETVFSELGSQPRRAMTELVDLGVRFAIDDFGTGYSSLARLKELPAQIVKLDRKFVAGVGTEVTDLGINRAVTELVRTMGSFCVAEGVEEATQHHLLRAIGVDAYQGYLFSAPLPPSDFRDFIAAAPVRRPRS
ncbi:diguanylate cyclase (GGDEF)-like protein/PAS domain S-box-containing protein [Saccharopolyspora lacisalsi]|uniref:Diguanylate cyclase (GGDEF)-like protein/PAS domain S-box-containing protein n=1 Tax=Halosaccharopolyspora lacisalsi TaxID=1000566 RepID=A0A839E135_9PSEU|nr:EAL domain-containing protein [Halosaccharopolyspora lacisalsi]MBA8826800.1 diguanylate cyclase (GGDEF)-like protein/PAS domain S-box-containing protein [Halosaccharopolyspora lacisalsi]